MKRAVDVVKVGDRIRFDDRIHVLAGLDGPRCRLLAEEDAGVQVLLLTQVLGAQDFNVLDHPRSTRRRVPVHGPLDGLDPSVREKALAWERHILEVETGHVGSHQDWPPRTGYDPAVRGSPSGRRPRPPRGRRIDQGPAGGAEAVVRLAAADGAGFGEVGAVRGERSIHDLLGDIGPGPRVRRRGRSRPSPAPAGPAPQPRPPGRGRSGSTASRRPGCRPRWCGRPNRATPPGRHAEVEAAVAHGLRAGRARAHQPADLPGGRHLHHAQRGEHPLPRLGRRPVRPALRPTHYPAPPPPCRSRPVRPPGLRPRARPEPDAHPQLTNTTTGRRGEGRLSKCRAALDRGPWPVACGLWLQPLAPERAAQGAGRGNRRTRGRGAWPAGRPRRRSTPGLTTGR